MPKATDDIGGHLQLGYGSECGFHFAAISENFNIGRYLGFDLNGNLPPLGGCRINMPAVVTGFL